MPNWLLTFIESLALPILEQLLISVLKGLEAKFPGITPLVEAIISYLNNGGTTKQLHEHLIKLDPSNFSLGSSCEPSDLVANT